MSISAYGTPLNKSTDQVIKLGLPSYLLIITGFSWLQDKKGGMLYTHLPVYGSYEISKFTWMNMTHALAFLIPLLGSLFFVYVPQNKIIIKTSTHMALVIWYAPLI